VPYLISNSGAKEGSTLLAYVLAAKRVFMRSPVRWSRDFRATNLLASITELLSFI
jgi:hypothetical protein